MINTLESRRLLAVSANLVAGKLSITGTPAADVISVNLSGSQIKVVSGSSTSSFLASAVQSIAADLLGGGDKLTISTAITKPTSIKGGTGDDTIIGGNGNDTLRGEAGNDSITGNWGDDLLDGNLDVDNLQGGKGDDTFTSGTGDDSIDGGEGSDLVDYSARTTRVRITLIYDTWVDPVTSTTGYGGEGNEKDSYTSIETVIGGQADDVIQYYDSDITSTIQSYFNIKLIGGPGKDVLVALGYTDSSNRSVSLFGGIGDDTLTSSHYGVSSYLYGEDGNDNFVTVDGRNSWDGPSGGELPAIYQLPKVIHGGNGSDVWNLTHYDSIYHPSEGFREYGTTPVAYTMSDTIENVNVYSDSPVKITGNDLNNQITVTAHNRTTLLGGGGNDRIIGSQFNDLIDGQSGNDYIDGEAGNDIITGGLGKDSLFGNLGNDTFYSNDSVADLVDGGPGTDKARSDGIDQLIQVESIF